MVASAGGLCPAPAGQRHGTIYRPRRRGGECAGRGRHRAGAADPLQRSRQRRDAEPLYRRRRSRSRPSACAKRIISAPPSGLLQRLHGSGLAFAGEMRLYPKLDQYLAMASTPALRELRRAGEALRPVIEPGWGPLRPCHIDPAPHNFIAAAGRHFLLDWEYAAMCDPVWDLAGLSIEGRFDPAQDAAMVAQYFGATSQLEAWGEPPPSLPHHAAAGRRFLGGGADRRGQWQLDGGRAGRSAGDPHGRRSRRSRPRAPYPELRLKVRFGVSRSAVYEH